MIHTCWFASSRSVPPRLTEISSDRHKHLAFLADSFFLLAFLPLLAAAIFVKFIEQLLGHVLTRDGKALQPCNG